MKLPQADDGAFPHDYYSAPAKSQACLALGDFIYVFDTFRRFARHERMAIARQTELCGMGRRRRRFHCSKAVCTCRGEDDPNGDTSWIRVYSGYQNKKNEVKALAGTYRIHQTAFYAAPVRLFFWIPRWP